MSLKPKVLLDVKSSRGTGVFTRRRKIVNLGYTKKNQFALGWFLSLPFLIILPVFLLGRATAPVTIGTFAQTVTNTEERRVLEVELQELEKQIDDYEKTINVYRSQGANLKGEINALNAKVNKLNLQIKAANLSLKKLDGEISNTTSKISDTEHQINS
jgi:septal ring factor EnvC (AmiA/AmiB activator)